LFKERHEVGVGHLVTAAPLYKQVNEKKLLKERHEVSVGHLVTAAPLCKQKKYIKEVLQSSVADPDPPDPHVFSLPGSGSGSFYH
jgi:hypothetical protein